jgi:thiamine biosynthesis lipoprotein
VSRDHAKSRMDRIRLSPAANNPSSVASGETLFDIGQEFLSSCGAVDCPFRATLVLAQWTGTSLGSPSQLLLYHDDGAAAAQIARECVAEIERLERIFALYRADSEIARLNRDGRIEFPSIDLLTVLSQCQTLSALSDGAFDVTVQPLWTLYAAHFFGNGAPPPDGPPARAIERTRDLVDWRAIDVGPRRIALMRPGMGVTLNGVAQGYITDRITDILRTHGCDRTFANLGCSEISALGRHANGRPWRVGLADPRQPE